MHKGKFTSMRSKPMPQSPDFIDGVPGSPGPMPVKPNFRGSMSLPS